MGPGMMRTLSAAGALLLLLGCSSGPTMPADAQAALELTNEMIDYKYVPPETPHFQYLFEKMQARRVLQRLAAFLSPLNLRGGLMLSLEEGGSTCKDPNSYYDGRGTLHLCYSWFDMLEKQASRQFVRAPGAPFTPMTPGLVPGVTRGEVIVGGTVSTLLHELGHFLFDVQEVPLFGREEDAADQIAALVMLQFGTEVSLATFKGSYSVWHHLYALRLLRSGGKVSMWSEANEHSIDVQRAYTELCMAYGKDQVAFKALAEQWLPRIRRSNCENEYRQTARAFNKTLKPDIDEAKMKRVLEMKVLEPADFE
jgi:Putative metallopeptidase